MIMFFRYTGFAGVLIASVCWFAGRSFTALADARLGISELTNRGATRNIALAGATAAFPNNHSAFIENPASIPFQPSLVNLSFANANINDSRIKSVSSGIDVTKRDELEGGVALRLFDVVGVGGGIVTESQRLERSDTSPVFGVDISQTTFPLSVAAHVFNELSVGVSYNIHITEISRLSAADASTTHLDNDVTAKYAGSSYKLSALYVANANLAVAVTHQLSQQLASTENGRSDIVLPSKTQIAAVYFIPPFGVDSGPFTENTIAAQIDVVTYSSDDVVYHPAAYMWQTEGRDAALLDETVAPADAKIVRGARYIPKLGIESLLFRKNDFEGQMWLGTYWEPALYANDSSRSHMTGGLELSAWFVVLRCALDIAEHYKNQSLGIGVALQF